MRVSRTFSAPQHPSRRLRPQRRARRAERPHVHRGEHSQPQVAILSSGAVVKRPIVVTDASGPGVIAIRSMVSSHAHTTTGAKEQRSTPSSASDSPQVLSCPALGLAKPRFARVITWDPLR